MEKLKDLDSLTIREKKEYAGIPSAWKFRPEFCLIDASDEEFFYAVSEKGAVLGFDFLKRAKTFTLYMVDRKGEEVLYFEKRFGLFSNKMNVYSSGEELLGSVQKNPKSIKTIYNVRDQINRLLYRIEGPAMDPENFNIIHGDTIVGRISRRWGKTMEEGVSRQDHFGIIFPMGCNTNEKSVLLGALFLVDFLC